MRLIDAVSESGARPVIPLVGYPGIAATGHSVADVLTAREPHMESLMFLEDRYHPPCLFHVMDLTVEAEALGLSVRFAEDGPPSVTEHPIDTLEKLGSLSVPDPKKDGRLPLFLDVVSRVAMNIDGMMGAYCVGPFTLAAELCGAEEVAVRTITEVGFMHDLMSFVTLVCQAYARALAAVGASVVAILEPTAVILSPAAFEKYCLEPLKSVASAVRDGGGSPVLHICGDSTHLLDVMVRTAVDGLSLDGPVDLGAALAAAPDDMVIIGNVDPVGTMLEGDPAAVTEAALALLGKFGGNRNYVLGTGCDLPIETPLENIDALMDAARSYD
jgi:MtaA/CmuA family methyltransferase